MLVDLCKKPLCLFLGEALTFEDARQVVSVPAQTIGDGESLEFTVVSSEFQDMELPEGYYAGALTVALEWRRIDMPAARNQN